MSASTIDLAVIPGDGIGPEVTAEALKVLEKAAAAEGIVLQQTHYKLGAQHWLETGETLPEEVLADLRTREAILFGAVALVGVLYRAAVDELVVREIVEKLRRPTRTIIIASHNLDELQRVADRVAVAGFKGLGNELGVGFGGGALIFGESLRHFKTTVTNWHMRILDFRLSIFDCRLTIDE